MQFTDRNEEIINFLPIAYHSLDINGIIITVNSAWCKLTGYSPKEAVGTYFGEFLPDDNQSFFPKYYKELKVKGKLEANTFKFRKKSGEFVDYSIYCNSEKGENEFFKGHFITVDISDAIIKEKELFKFRELYRILADNIQDVVFVYNLNEDRYAYISPSILQLRGLTVEEAKREKIGDSLSPESRILFEEAIKTASNKFLSKPDIKNHIALELKQKCKDGSYVGVEVISKFKLASNGDLEMICITKRIYDSMLEDTISTARELELDKLFIFSSEAICLIDRTGNMVRATKSFEQVTGYRITELSHKKIFKFLLQKDASDFSSALTITDSSDINVFEWPFILKDGTYKTLRWRLMTYDENTVYASVLDITSKNTGVQKIIATQEVVPPPEVVSPPEVLIQDNTDNVKTKSTPSLNPISEENYYQTANAVNDFTGLLLKNITLLERREIENQLKIIYKLSMQSASIAQDNKLFTGIVNGTISPDPKIFMFEDVCKDIVDSIIISNEERRVKINYNGSKGKNYIYADIDMFRSIFQKFITHIVHHCPQEQEIDINIEKSEKFYVIHISNTIKESGVNSCQNILNSPATKDIGLARYLELALLIGGKIVIEDNPKKQDLLRFIIPAGT